MIMLRRRPTGLSAAVCPLLLATLAFGLAVPAGFAEAKTPGKRYCFLGVCHRVQTIAETEREIGRTTTRITSHYDGCHRDPYNPCGLTSSGEAFRADRPDNAASPIYPNGTKLLVWHGGTRKAAVVRVNNAGPYWGNRTLDVSRATAEKLGFARSGVARLHVKVLAAPTGDEASYQRNRRYAPVPGPLAGLFRSVEAAFIELAQTRYNIFPSPVHVVAGRQTPREALALAKAERRRVTVVADGRSVSRHVGVASPPRRGWLAQGRKAGSVGPVKSARSAQELPVTATEEQVMAWNRTAPY